MFKNNNLRGIIVLFLAVALCFSLTACKDKKTDQQQTAEDASPAPSATPDAATPEPATPTPSPTSTPTPVPVTAEIRKDGAPVTSAEAMAGTVFQLTATVSDGSTGGVWASSDESIVTVDANGVVSCWKKGTAKITYTLGDVSAECSLTVSEPVVKILYGGAAKADITLNGLWGYTIQLEASVSPADAEYSWSVDDESIASVSEAGLVTALKAGTTNVRLKCGTVSATCILRVIGTPPVRSRKRPQKPPLIPMTPPRAS